MRCNIVRTIRVENAGRLDRPALIGEESTLGYAALLDAADGMAVRLEELGVRPGDRVALLSHDSPAYVVASLALLGLGAVVVPISPTLSGDEAGTIVERMDVSGTLVDESPRASPDEAGVDLPACRHRFSWRPRAAVETRPAAWESMGPAFIRFSSGTTGRSKGVLLSHEALHERTDAADGGLGVRADDRVLWFPSMSFHFAATILLFLRRGAATVLPGRDFPGSLGTLAAAGAPTLVYGTPFHFDLLTRSSAVEPRAFEHVRLAVSTAVRLPQETATAFEGKFGIPLSEAYGIIEVGLPFLRRGGEPGGLGRPLPGYEVRIGNPDGEGIGTILLRGKGMFDAYCSPWELRTERFPDGWFDTGDLGRLDGEGRLSIVGREKQVINFLGMKLFPEEIEEVLDRFPGVLESRVDPLFHPAYGELPVATVVPRNPERPFDRDALRSFCLERLAPHKVPKKFDLADRLERTASGKLLRRRG